MLQSVNCQGVDKCLGGQNEVDKCSRGLKEIKIDCLLYLCQIITTMILSTAHFPVFDATYLLALYFHSFQWKLNTFMFNSRIILDILYNSPSEECSVYHAFLTSDENFQKKKTDFLVYNAVISVWNKMSPNLSKIELLFVEKCALYTRVYDKFLYNTNQIVLFVSVYFQKRYSQREKDTKEQSCRVLCTVPLIKVKGNCTSIYLKGW